MYNCAQIRLLIVDGGKYTVRLPALTYLASVSTWFMSIACVYSLWSVSIV